MPSSQPLLRIPPFRVRHPVWSPCKSTQQSIDQLQSWDVLWQSPSGTKNNSPFPSLAASEVASLSLSSPLLNVHPARPASHARGQTDRKRGDSLDRLQAGTREGGREGRREEGGMWGTNHALTPCEAEILRDRQSEQGERNAPEAGCKMR